MVTEPKTLKLLLVEDDLEDGEFLSEALIEIEENRLWCNWETASVIHVEQLSDALDCLRRESFDAILLNLSLPDSRTLLNSFLEVNARARGAPIVVLADHKDENLANRLIREGAQDVFLKPELECAPLARSIRYAIERRRRTQALRCSPFIDDLTGALTREGFLAIVEHYSRLLHPGSANLILTIVQFKNVLEHTPEGRDLRDPLLIRAAEVLRGAVPEPVILGRLERWRFGLITVGMTEAELDERLLQAVVQLEEAARRGNSSIATVGFFSFEVHPGDDIEELLNHYDADHACVTRGAEQVMLAS